MMKIGDLSNIRVANEKWKEIENSLSEEQKIGHFSGGFMRKENQEDAEFLSEERRKNGEDWEFN